MPRGQSEGSRGPGRGHNNLPFSYAPQGQTAEVKLTRADLRGLGFWDTYRVVLLGNSSCFKLEATLNREQIHEVFLPWKETKGLGPQSRSLDSLGQRLRGRGGGAARKQRPGVETVEAEGPNSRTLPDQQRFPEPEVCEMRGSGPAQGITSAGRAVSIPSPAPSPHTLGHPTSQLRGSAPASTPHL